MVAVGPDGKAVPVPPWQPRTAEERRRQAAAVRRRELRREIQRVTSEIKASAGPDEPAPA
jgi:acyl-CoA hydrolase